MKKGKDFSPLMLAWITICIVLTIAYLVEFILGNRTLNYLVSFLFLLYFCFASSILLPKLAEDKCSFELSSAIFYSIFYSYTLFTGRTPIIFVYVFPMLFGIIASRQLFETKLFALLCTGIACVYAAYYLPEAIMASNAIEYEIIIACMLLSFMSISTTTLEVTDRISRLEETNKRDSLTDIYNRNMIVELQKNGYFWQRVGLILGDVDKFKAINDTYGHEKGDETLIKIANCLKSVVKHYPDAYAIRIGGDEFVILSKATDAECILRDVTQLLKKEDIHMSFGIACAETSYDNLYKEADKKMYENKNKIC